MAGYSNLSATANFIEISKDVENDQSCPSWDNKEFKNHSMGIESVDRIKDPTNSPKHQVCNITLSVTTLPIAESEKKVYIPTYVNNLRVVGCVDSGSDLTIMHFSLFNRLGIEKFKLQVSEIKQVTSFSEQYRGQGQI